MLEAYSENITVGANSPISFNNVAVKKGCSVELSGPATIQFNKAGVYMIECDACFTPTAAGEISIQLSKNGVLQPQSISTKDGEADTATTMNFVTFVQVTENNNRCNCCAIPTVAQIINSAEGEYSIAHIVVTKIC